jgi:hypothetical protein
MKLAVKRPEHHQQGSLYQGIYPNQFNTLRLKTLSSDFSTNFKLPRVIEKLLSYLLIGLVIWNQSILTLLIYSFACRICTYQIVDALAEAQSTQRKGINSEES